MPIGLHLRTVAAFGTRAMAHWVTRSLAPDSTVKCDGLACFAAVSEAGCVAHEPTVMGNSSRVVKAGAFEWVNTILGNLRKSLHGTYHDFALKHAPRYLAEF